MRDWVGAIAVIGVLGTFLFGWIQSQPQLCAYGLPFPLCISDSAAGRVAEPGGAGEEEIPPEPYSLGQLDRRVAAAVEDARVAQREGQQAAMVIRQLVSRAEEAARRAASGDARFVVVSHEPEWRGERLSAGATVYGVLASGEAVGEFRYDERRTDEGGMPHVQFRFTPLRHRHQSPAGRFEGSSTGQDNQWIGPGRYAFANGDTYEGRWQPDSSVSGVWQFANGQRYEGQFEDLRRAGFDLQKHGYGVLWNRDGQVIRAGRWSHGEFAG